MESLSEPASSILQRSLSAGNGRMADSSSGSSCSNTPTAAGTGAAQPSQSPLGAEQRAEQQPKAGYTNQQALASTSSDSSSADYGAGTSFTSSMGGGADGSSTPAQHPQEAAMSLLGPQQKGQSRSVTAPGARQPGGPGLEPSALGRHSSTMPISPSSHASQVVGPPCIPQDAAAVSPAAGADSSGQAAPSNVAAQPSSSDKTSSSTAQRSSSSPPRRVAAVAAALEAAALACTSSDTSSQLPPSPTAGRVRQSSIPALSRGGSKTPTGLGHPPLVRRPSSGKVEQLNDLQQPLQPQEHREQPSPSSMQQQQQHVQEELPLPEQKQPPQPQQLPQQPQQRVSQQQMPSRLPRRLPQAPGSSTASSPAADPGSRTSTPDPMKRKQHAGPSAPAIKPLPGSPTAAAAAAAAASSRSPSGSAVHLRVLAAQKQSQKHLSSVPDGGSDTPAASTAAAAPTGSGQPSYDSVGAGRVMQMAAAIAANAEAVARSASPQRPSKQPSQPQAQLQQQQQPNPQQQQQQQHDEEIALPPPPAAAEVARAAAAENAAQPPAQQAAGSSKAAGEAEPSEAAAAAPPNAAAPAPVKNSSPPGPRPAGPSPAGSPLQDKARGSTGASPGHPTADSDDLWSSTYDNLHGLLLKKGDIEICRWVATSLATLFKGLAQAVCTACVCIDSTP